MRTKAFDRIYQLLVLKISFLFYDLCHGPLELLSLGWIQRNIGEELMVFVHIQKSLDKSICSFQRRSVFHRSQDQIHAFGDPFCSLIQIDRSREHFDRFLGHHKSHGILDPFLP